jgi:rRNA maturation endonuclease Nob1
MSEETKKVEKIEQEAKQEGKPAELSEQDLEQVAGGAGTAVKNKDYLKSPQSA